MATSAFIRRSCRVQRLASPLPNHLCGQAKHLQASPIPLSASPQITGSVTQRRGVWVSTAAETETETAPQLNDIEERLGKYEWEKRNLADLPGKTALVTGGNSGMGFAICLALAKPNAQVILTARNPEEGKKAADMINYSLKTDNVEAMELDVGSFDKIQASIKAFEEKQPLHILVNNAGIHLPGDNAPEKSGQHTPQGFEVTLGTNYYGPLLLTHLLLDNLKANAPARIVNQGSPMEQLSGGIPWDDLKYRAGITKAPLYDKTDKSKPMGANVAISQAIGGQPTERGASPILYATASPELDNKGGAFIGGPTGPGLPFSNLDQYKDPPTYLSQCAEEGKSLDDCLRLYEETLKIIQP